MGKDTEAIEAHIKNLTKLKPCITYDNNKPRAFGLCKVSISKDGHLSIPDYDVVLIPPNPYEQINDESSFIAEGKTRTMRRTMMSWTWPPTQASLLYSLFLFFCLFCFLRGVAGV